MDDNMKVNLVNDALYMALKSRKPPKGLIWHMPERNDKCPWGTDRGSQYASYSHRDLLAKNGITQSMSTRHPLRVEKAAVGIMLSLKAFFIH